MASVGSAAWMKQVWGPGCAPDLVAMPIYEGGPRFQCDRRARPAFQLLGRIFVRWGYVIHTAGCYNCRKNTSNPAVLSNHSWATALDVNEATNPYRRDKLVTDMPTGMLDEIRAVRTVSGARVFRCGADWDGDPLTEESSYDAMHIEIICSPEDLATGFVAMESLATNGRFWPVVRIGARGPAIVKLQDLLKLERTTGNGIFGPRTEMAVRLYQQSRKLVPDGIVGAATWTALLTGQPPVPHGVPGPLK